MDEKRRRQIRGIKEEPYYILQISDQGNLQHSRRKRTSSRSHNQKTS